VTRLRVDGWRLDRLHSQVHAHCLEDGRQAAEGRVAGRREGAVKLRRVQVRLRCHFRHAAKSLGHLAQGNQQFILGAIRKDAIQQFDGEGGCVIPRLIEPGGPNQNAYVEILQRASTG